MQGWPCNIVADVVLMQLTAIIQVPPDIDRWYPHDSSQAHHKQHEEHQRNDTSLAVFYDMQSLGAIISVDA